MSQHLGLRPTLLATLISVCTSRPVNASIRLSDVAPRRRAQSAVRTLAPTKRFRFAPSPAGPCLTARAPVGLLVRVTLFLVVRRLRAVRVFGLMAPPIELWWDRTAAGCGLRVQQPG